MNTTIKHTGRDWLGAYGRFLRSRDESIILKVAPLLIIFGAPEVIVSNLVPFVGEALDVGTVGVSLIVAARTFAAVRKYR